MVTGDHAKNSGTRYQSFQKILDANGTCTLLLVLDICSIAWQLQQPGDVFPLTFGRFIRFSVPLQLADDCVFRRRYMDFERVAVTKMLDRGAGHRGDVKRALATEEDIDLERRGKVNQIEPGLQTDCVPNGCFADIEVFVETFQKLGHCRVGNVRDDVHIHRRSGSAVKGTGNAASSVVTNAEFGKSR